MRISGNFTRFGGGLTIKSPVSSPSIGNTYAGVFTQSEIDVYQFQTVNPLTLTTGEFTIEAFVKIDPTAGDGAYQNNHNIFSNRSWYLGQGAGWEMIYNKPSATVKLKASTGAYNTFPSILSSSSTITPNVWNHIAFTRDASDTVTCWINGVADSTAVEGRTLNSAHPSAPAINPRIGSALLDNTQSDLFNGSISTARLSTVCRYTSNFDPLAQDYSADANTRLLVLNNATHTVEGNTTATISMPLGQVDLVQANITNLGS